MCAGGWVIMCVCVCATLPRFQIPASSCSTPYTDTTLNPDPFNFQLKNIGTRTAGALLTEGLAIISPMCNELQIEQYKFGTPQILNTLKLYQGHSSFTDWVDCVLMSTSIIREITVSSFLVRTIGSYCHLVSN
jgi:hypothetical protein